MPQAFPSKSELRGSALARRDALPVSGRQSAAKALAEQTWFKAGDQVVSAYYAIGSEIDPAALLEALNKTAAQLALPVLLDAETMVFRAWDRSKPLVPVGFGTLGPDADQPEVLPNLVLAPLAAFSSTGQRIGYGKGHYDRALSKMQAQGHRPAFVGLAFDEQEVPSVDAEAHDVPLDGVLTPSGLRVFDHGREALQPFLV
ncbi:MAG: 5-formyltetrahydrofolate cyclo-ligase [Rhizobiales bacterium]|nr:5-formyltetrahydrofolate cyclo-ligase [Hyphomicrobiales bacterium]MBO6700235.1 5-formyltetrahydrofolate cyclo-ligase [Hyphomicrobiales bacterium]MBO6737600.1 5-formyltetrahydrofolate cyclo-ligase [Hyphomicrobiales bacterium]MBO6913343.1 5-formyltetrahydrofolate cyclo-ligase [Hyphomicrobiales bacterium]MBO6955861.1 5-formyltetrahydrofolate cyclo-ligase [Hyphomicrobiales bacterium]